MIALQMSPKIEFVWIGYIGHKIKSLYRILQLLQGFPFAMDNFPLKTL